ncbi:MAG: hypothetical protein ABI880_12090 [Acidobacteriota bacterium]
MIRSRLFQSLARCAPLAAALLFAVVSPTQAQTTFLQRLTSVSGQADDLFGQAVAIDGDTAVVGAQNESGSGGTLRVGGAYVYNKVNGIWVQGQRLERSVGPLAYGYFGTEVAISGNTIAVAAAQEGDPAAPSTSSSGSVYIYVRSGTTWVQQARLVASDKKNTAYFGASLALEGDQLVVGSFGWDAPAATDIGAAYVFERTGTTWAERRLTASDPVIGDQLGSAVDISGTTACVGANHTNGATIDEGSVYVYVRGPSGWAQQQKVVVPGTSSLGIACAVEGDTLLAGSINRAYVFSRSGTTWTLAQRLVPSVAGSFFGYELTLKGDLALVTDSEGSPTPGAVYAFVRSGATWTETQRITPTTPGNGQSFGSAIDLDASSVIIGASFTWAFPSSPAGTAYVFNRTAITTGPPGEPTNFQASANGSVLNASWGAPTSGAAPTSYTLLARTTPGAAPIATVPVGVGNSFAATAPNGTFLLSLRAANGSGTGPESTSVTVTFPGGALAPPGAPTGLGVSVAGTTATFTWTAPAAGGAPAGYVLLAGTAPGFATPIATLPVAVAPTSFAVPGVPAGTYYVRLVAQNAGGSSGSSNEVSLIVAGPAAPAAPALNPATVSGHTVNLSWTPGGGGAPTSYVMTAFTSGGTVLATVPLTGTAASFAGVPSGSYAVRLVAVNGVGPSPVSNTITLVVP